MYLNRIVLTGLVLLTSCSTVTKIENPHIGIIPKDSGCKVQFFNGTIPKNDFLSLTKIETHIEKNFFFGGTVTLDDEAFDELRDHVCELGGDAVIIDDFIETSALEFTHIHVWATIIKFVRKEVD